LLTRRVSDVGKSSRCVRHSDEGDDRSPLSHARSQCVEHPSWNIAYQNAIIFGASFSDAEAKAWEAWRYAMSFFAAKEYNQVMKVERNRTKAMAAFWRFAHPSVPRP